MLQRHPYHIRLKRASPRQAECGILALHCQSSLKRSWHTIHSFTPFPIGRLMLEFHLFVKALKYP